MGRARCLAVFVIACGCGGGASNPSPRPTDAGVSGKVADIPASTEARLRAVGQLLARFESDLAAGAPAIRQLDEALRARMTSEDAPILGRNLLAIARAGAKNEAWRADAQFWELLGRWKDLPYFSDLPAAVPLTSALTSHEGASCGPQCSALASALKVTFQPTCAADCHLAASVHLMSELLAGLTPLAGTLNLAECGEAADDAWRACHERATGTRCTFDTLRDVVGKCAVFLGGLGVVALGPGAPLAIAFAIAAAIWTLDAVARELPELQAICERHQVQECPSDPCTSPREKHCPEAQGRSCCPLFVSCDLCTAGCVKPCSDTACCTADQKCVFGRCEPAANPPDAGGMMSADAIVAEPDASAPAVDAPPDGGGPDAVTPADMAMPDAATPDAAVADATEPDAASADGGSPDALADGPSSCSDQLQNGNESDVDCGGSCAPCMPCKRCAAGADCMTGYCGVGGKCSGKLTASIDWLANCNVPKTVAPGLPTGYYLVTALPSGGTNWDEPWTPPTTGWWYQIECAGLQVTNVATPPQTYYESAATAFANLRARSEVVPFAGGDLVCTHADTLCSDNHGGISFDLEYVCP